VRRAPSRSLFHLRSRPWSQSPPRLDIFEYQFESPAVTDDFLKVVLRLDLFFEIQLLLCQLVPKLSDLLVGDGILNARAICFATSLSSPMSSRLNASSCAYRR